MYGLLQMGWFMWCIKYIWLYLIDIFQAAFRPQEPSPREGGTSAGAVYISTAGIRIYMKYQGNRSALLCPPWDSNCPALLWADRLPVMQIPWVMNVFVSRLLIACSASDDDLTKPDEDLV